jgi:hypothetical protein
MHKLEDDLMQEVPGIVAMISIAKEGGGSAIIHASEFMDDTDLAIEIGKYAESMGVPLIYDVN